MQSVSAPLPQLELDRERRTVAAFDRLRPKYAAISAADLLPVHARVTTVVGIMAAARRCMAAPRDEPGRVGGFDPSLIDEPPLSLPMGSHAGTKLHVAGTPGASPFIQ